MKQMCIPGTQISLVVETLPQCITLLLEVQRSLARATVPENYIKNSFAEKYKRTRVKRLRENMIMSGYELMMHLDEGLKFQDNFNNHLWKDDVINIWNQFAHDVCTLSDYVQENTQNFEA